MPCWADPGLARVSSSPGKTTLLNFYRLPSLYLVDLPGYGFARASKTDRAGYRKLIHGYLRSRQTLSGIVWLLDIRHDPSKEDREMQELLIESRRPVLAVLTKSDKLSRSTAAARQRELAEILQLRKDQVEMTSSRSAAGNRRAGPECLGSRPRGKPMSLRHLALAVLVLGCARPATGQSPTQGRPLPQGYGSLSQDDLSLRVGDDNLVIRFVPLDPRLMPWRPL